MANVYKQSSITQIGDQVCVEGTVDGISVRVGFWASAVVNMTDEEKIAFVAKLMYDKAYPSVQDLTSQFPSEVSL